MLKYFGGRCAAAAWRSGGGLRPFGTLRSFRRAPPFQSRSLSANGRRRRELNLVLFLVCDGRRKAPTTISSFWVCNGPHPHPLPRTLRGLSPGGGAEWVLVIKSKKTTKFEREIGKNQNRMKNLILFWFRTFSLIFCWFFSHIILSKYQQPCTGHADGSRLLIFVIGQSHVSGCNRAISLQVFEADSFHRKVLAWLFQWNTP